MESDSETPVAVRWVAEFVSGPDDGRVFTFYTARVGNVGAGVSRLSTRSPDRSRDVSKLLRLVTVGPSDCDHVAKGMVELVRQPDRRLCRWCGRAFRFRGGTFPTIRMTS